MSSQRYIEYDKVFEKLTELEDPTVGIDFRPNTRLIGEWEEDGNFRIDVILYDKPIASLYPDGMVYLDDRGHRTNTTKNRMNDVLIPLGWRMRSVGGKWQLIRLKPSHSPMDGPSIRDFRGNTLVK